MLLLVCFIEFLHVHVCVWMSVALSLTRCWDVWEIKYESCYCARACALPAGTVCAFERRGNCYGKRNEKMKTLPEFVSSWNAKQLFFHLWVFAHAAPRCCCLADGLLRVGVGRLSDPCAAPLWPDWNLRALQETGVHSLTAASPEVGLCPPATDQSRKISCVIAQLSGRLKQLGVMRKPSAR